MGVTPDGRLTRRQVMRGGLMAGAVALARPSVARSARMATERPELLPVSADVWAASVAVTGAPSNGTLSVNGVAVPAVAQGSGVAASLPLQPGTNVADLRAPAGRAATQTYTARVRAGPTARIHASVQGQTVRLDSAASATDPYTGSSLDRVEWIEEGAVLGEGRELLWSGPRTDGEHYVSCRITDTRGSADTATCVFTVTGGVPSLPGDGWEAQWMADAVVYGAVPPLFGAPPLEAVTEALDRLAALGITVIWLAPIFATVPGDFGYAVTDHFSVRPDYGTLDDLRQLTAEAHDRGLRVILDMPLNDTSASHPYFTQAKRFKQAESRYWGFYERNSSGEPVHYFSWRKLPNLSYDSGEVRRFAVEAAAHWIREVGVDGFRCDAAWGVAARAPGFWREWAEEVRRIRPDALLLAEAPAGTAQYAEEGFTAAYDWGENLGEWAWRRAFTKRGPNLDALRSALASPQAIQPFRFLDNNDTGSRFITRYGAGVTKAALALMLSLPGLPCVYTGEETGAEYLPYKQTTPLHWTADPHSLQPLIARLLEERRERPALQRGRVEILDAEPAGDVLALAASVPAEMTVLAVNFREAAVETTVRLPSGEKVNLRLDAYGYARLDA